MTAFPYHLLPVPPRPITSPAVPPVKRLRKWLFGLSADERDGLRAMLAAMPTHMVATDDWDFLWPNEKTLQHRYAAAGRSALLRWLADRPTQPCYMTHETARAVLQAFLNLPPEIGHNVSISTLCAVACIIDTLELCGVVPA